MKRKRRRATANDPLDLAQKKRAVSKDRGLLEGSIIDGLPPPNQLLPAGVHGRNMFPLMGLQIEHKESSRASHAFVHPRYGSYYSGYWNNTPPSWMDPMLLADMAKKDPTVRNLLQRAVKANKKLPYLRALSRELGKVFENEYLPWVIEKFAETQTLVAEWLIINAVDKKLRATEDSETAARIDNRRQRKKRARQKRSSEVG